MNRLEDILIELTQLAKSMDIYPYTVDECETHVEILATLEHMRDISLKQYTDRMAAIKLIKDRRIIIK